MSEEIPAAPPPPPGPGSPPPAGSAPPPKGKQSRLRRWGRRLAWCGLGFIVLLIIIRVTIPFTLPWALSRLAAAYELTVTYERMDRSFLGGYAEIWHLTIAPAEGGEPFAHFEYMEADLVTSSLLFGKIHVRRLEIDGADLLVDRDEAGKLRLFRRLGLENWQSPEPRPAPEPRAQDPEPAEVDLRPPIAIDALRLQHLDVRVRDRSVSPPLDTQITASLRLSDLGSEARPARFEVHVASPDFLDTFHAGGLATTTKDAFTATFEADLRGLHLAPLAGYLEPFGLRPAASGISFRARGTARAAAIAEPGAVEAAIRIEDVDLAADGETVLALDELAVDAPSVSRGAAHVKEVRFAGARVLASITGAGHPRAAGIELAGRQPSRPERPTAPPAAARPAAPPAAAPPPAVATPAAVPADQAAPPPPPFRLRIDRVALLDASAALRDETFLPAASLIFRAAEVAVEDIVKDPARPEAAAAITARLDAPGILDDLRIDGRAVPFARRKTLELGFAADGIRLAALAPYLERVGAEPALPGGRFDGTLDAAFEARDDGTIAADLRIGPAVFAGAETLLELGGLDVCGIEVRPESNTVSIDDIAGSGPRIAARRDGRGNVEILGIRFLPGGPSVASARPTAPVEPPADEPIAQASPAAFREEAPPEAAAPAARPLRLEIGRLRWSGVGASFADDAVLPAALIALEDAGLAIEDFSVDLDPDAPDAPSRFTASLSAPGVAEKVSVTGALDPRPSSAWLDAEVAASGISFSALAPYLAAAGVEPAANAGTAACSLAVDLSTLGGLLDAGLAIRDARFGDGEMEFAGLDALRVTEVEAGGGGVRIASIEVERPRASVFRDEEGGVHAGGFRLVPRPDGAAAPPAEPPPAPPPPLPPAGAGADPPAPGAAPPGASFRLAELRVRDARLEWTDRALEEPLTAGLTASAEVDGFAIGSAEPAHFRLRAALDGALDEATAEGTLALEPGAAAATVDVRARGLRAGPFAGYLPPGVRVGLTDGRFEASVEAASAPAPEGGRSARLVVSGVDYRDGEGPSLLRLGSFKVIATRIDPAGGRVDIDEVSAAGFEMGVVLPEPGAAETLGVVVAPPQGPAGDEEPPAPAGPEAAPAPPAPAPRRGLALRAKRPRVTLRKLDLGLERFSVLSGPPGEATPLVLEKVRLSNAEEIDVLGEHPEENPPILLSLAGRLAPLVDSFEAGFRLLPFAGQPRLEVEAKAEGVNGKDLTAVLPLLAGKVDGTGLEDGRLAARFEMTLRPDSRGALDAGIGRAFGIEAILKETSFRSGADGPVLLGLDELRVDVARIVPSTGAVHVKDIEIQKPVAAVRRVPEGVEVAGILVKLPEAPDGDAPAGEAAGGPPAGREEEAAASGPAAAPAAAPGPAAERPEMRIDKLLVNGVDFRADDTTSDPPFHFWLDDVEVEVRNITNRLLTDPKPVRFHVAARSGKVPIPVPLAASLVTGVLADASAVMSGKQVDTSRRVEERPVFEDFTLSGKVSLHPKLGGWTETRLSGLELAAFGGPASQFGVDLHGGIFDQRTVLRFPGDGSAEAEVRLKVTDLDVTEPSDGPIFRYLKLPAPLGSVIFAIRDENGVISVPVDTSVSPDGLGGGALAAAVLGTLGKVIGQAFLNTPFRLASTLTSLVPGEEAPPEPEEPIELEFPGGGPDLPRADAAKLEALIERLADGELLQVALRHDFGGKDLDRAWERANPPLEDCLEMAEGLRREKTRWLHLREEAAARARNAVLGGLWRESAAATARLREIDIEIQTADQGLQDLYERVRPGAERRAPRRAREAAVALARARLGAVEAALAPAAGERAGEAIRPARPIVPETAAGDTGKVLVIVTPARE